ncbi:hypothetical protein EVG20_g4715 [Dentipellis fragilis]|uniref:Copper transport protein n=1 Tax=Dentipellis fragilis TaxID=205917 RepID=A0A4Y9YXA0_9AGAM|nr:hypothetical protein EVG20_g4715 [Dentipellis fragilis]
MSFRIILVLVGASLLQGALAHDNGMDMSMDNGMTMTMGNMIMYLHFTPGDNLWFLGWAPFKAGAMVGACLGLFMLALLERWLAAIRGVMEVHWQKRAQIALSNRLNMLDTKASSQPSSTRGVFNRRSAPPFIFWHDVSRGILQIGQSLLSFLFMLAVMTFQVGFILSIVIGLGVGEALFGRSFSSRGLTLDFSIPLPVSPSTLVCVVSRFTTASMKSPVTVAPVGWRAAKRHLSRLPEMLTRDVKPSQVGSSCSTIRGVAGSDAPPTPRTSANQNEYMFDVYSELSPWHPAPFTHTILRLPEPLRFTSAGQFVCASDAYALSDMCSFRDIMLGMPLHRYPRSQDEDLLLEAAMLRLRCDQSMQRALLETGSRKLYFVDPDPVWGTGCREGRECGRNLWGKVLMLAREALGRRGCFGGRNFR